MKLAWAGVLAIATLCLPYGNEVHGESIGPASIGISLMLGEKDDGRVVTVHVGQPVHVSLPENASSGYRWVVEHMDPDQVELTTHDATYTSRAVGSGGLALFSFRPLKPGAAEVVLKHWRHWEGDTASIRRFRLLMQVEP